MFLVCLEKFVMLLYQNNIKKNIENYIYFRQILQHKKFMKIAKQKTSKPCMWDFTMFLDQFSPYIENNHNTIMHYAGNIYHKICN